MANLGSVELRLKKTLCPIYYMQTKSTANRVFDRPVGEARRITEMSEVVDVTEQFVLELRKHYHWDWTILVKRPRVALKARSKVADVRCNPLYHCPPTTTSVV